MYKIILIFIILLPATKINAQTIGFDIMNGNNKIGAITAKKSISNNKFRYEINSTAEYTILFRKTVRQNITIAEFLNKKLITSQYKLIENNDLKEDKLITKEGSAYKSSFNNISRTLDYNINFSSSMLYFYEPKGINFIFSEAYQEMSSIEYLGNNTYKLTLPDGKVNHYIYEKGQLKEIIVYRPFFTIRFKRTTQIF